MKRLNLDALGLNATEVLSREQMKHIQGGNETCKVHSDCPPKQVCVVYDAYFGMCYTSKELQELTPIQG